MEKYLDNLRKLKPTSYRYLTIYERLIKRASLRPKKRSDVGFYVESHHIFPKSLCDEAGKTDQANRVFLTFKEHLLAHKILARIFPTVREFQRAYFAMFSARNTSQPKRMMTIREAEYFKSQSSHIFSRKGEENGMYGRNQTHETRAKISAKAKGRKASPETRMRMSERQLGKDNPFYGKTHSKETLKRLSEACSGPRPSRRSVYTVTSPLGEVFTFKGKQEMKSFCVERGLSPRKIADSVGKGVITTTKFPLIMTDQTRNCIGWSVDRVSPQSS